MPTHETPTANPPVGSVVTLKSGSPLLTVVKHDGPETTCTWFPGDAETGWGRPEIATFPADALTVTAQPKED